MTIQEVKQKIHESKLWADYAHEQSKNAQKEFAYHIGEFEAILSGNGDEKYLVPESGSLLYYLYRGQNEEYVPCVPSMYRGDPSVAQIFVERMRLVVFRRMLRSHPVVEHFFKRHNFVVDEEGLAQHYGLKTSVLDLTSNLDVALFFATCQYNSDTDSYQYYDDDKEHEAILYVFDPFLDNEPCPPTFGKHYMRGNIRPIGLQAFPRPGAQDAYSLHIPKGESTKSWIYRFTFTSEDSKHYYEKFKEGEALWIHDSLISITKRIASQTEFSYDVFKETYNQYRPKGLSRNKLKEEIRQELPNIVIRKGIPDIAFSKEERANIIGEWNNRLGREVCSKIVRKPWFNHSHNKITGKVTNIHNRSEFMTFNHLTEKIWLRMVGTPEGPIDAEWLNYKNTPCPQKRIQPNDGKYEKVEASMNTEFGTSWLEEKDWIIRE